ncbi:MAG: Gfo/Idh/MocA family oxidoreductase, partial [Spirochaetia bacterium]
MQKRFEPHSPGRVPDNWDQVVRSFKARETPLVVIVYGLFSLGRDWVGSEPVSVFATQEIGQGGVDEKHFEQGCTVFGERGNIYIPQAFSQVEILRFGRMVEATLFITDHRIGSRQTETVRIEAVHQWRLEQEFFADRVLTGRTIELPGENGVANMRAIDAVVQSARTGTPVEL